MHNRELRFDHFARAMEWDKVNPTVKVVTFYEDASAGLRARQMLERLSNELKDRFKTKNEIWKFALLEDPALRKHAARAASAADIVLMSLTSGTGLPAHVTACAREWLPEKRGGVSALVALMEANEATHRPICGDLRRMAAEGGMAFFCNVDPWPQEYPLHGHEISYFQDDPRWPMHQASFDEYSASRDWGINE